MTMQMVVGFFKMLSFTVAALIGVKVGEIMVEITEPSDALRKLQMKGLAKSKEQPKIRRLAAEDRHLGYNPPIVVFNRNCRHSGNMTSLIIPTTLGALGCAYMWWKGSSFFDLMCVTKRNMANVVSNLTKYLEGVTEVSARHLKLRIENFDDKMLKQNEHDAGVQKSLSDIDFDLHQLQNMVSSLVAIVEKSRSDIDFDLRQLQIKISSMDEKISFLEYKQELANFSLQYLCNFVDEKKENPEALKELM